MDSEKHRDLGSWTGLQKAFAAVAGSCSAARAQCLKQVRDSRMLDDLGLTWEESTGDTQGAPPAFDFSRGAFSEWFLGVPCERVCFC